MSPRRRAYVVLFASFAAFLFLLPQFLQSLLGYSALQSGLTTFPQAVGVILASQFVGKLYHTVGPRRLVAAGLLGVSLSNIPFMFITLGTGLWTIRLLMLARGMSMAFSFVPLQASTYANIQGPDTGRASAIFSTQRQSSAALGVAILATIFISRTNHSAKGMPMPEALVSGYHAAYLIAALLAYVAAITAFSIIRDAEKNNYRFSSLVLGVVKSEQFQSNMKGLAYGAATGAE